MNTPTNSSPLLKCLPIGLGALGLFFALLSANALPAEEFNQQRDFFEKKIRPVLVKHCYECHSHAATEPKGELLLDSRQGLLDGGESGPSVVPGDLDESLLIGALQHDTFEMPPEEKLPQTVINDFIHWIKSGAYDPRDQPADWKSSAQELWQETYHERKTWWSLQPLQTFSPPEVHHAAWPQTPLDRFILKKLEDQSLTPAPPADRPTLIRRLYFTLLGLPPSPEEVTLFTSDNSPEAYSQLIERLLNSPHFGERWARHWMDVVRYGDTYGYEWDIPAKGSWRYRDYLIRAFNEDIPFNQLTREQIAGDLLSNPRLNQIDQINESLLGTMFYQLGEKRHGDSAEFDGIHQEMLDNKIDAFSKAFQATTLSCARCHDHKLDPIAQSEYYALGGVFMSSRWVSNTLDLPQRHATQINQLKQIKQQLRPLLSHLWLNDLKQLTPDKLSQRLKPTKTKEPEENPGPQLESLPHLWNRLQTAAQQGQLKQTWNDLAQQYHQEHKTRTRHNQQNFTLIADFTSGIPEGWSIDGVGLQEPTRNGDFTLNLQGPKVIGRFLPAGFFTDTYSPRLNGAIRSPYLNQLDAPWLSFEVAGGDFSATRTVVDNAFLTERQKHLNNQQPTWKTLSAFPDMHKRKIYHELATKTSNLNFPPRVGLGGKCSEEQTQQPQSWFGITRVLAHQQPTPPTDELTRFLPLFNLNQSPPENLEQTAERFKQWMSKSITTWQSNQTDPADIKILNTLLETELISNQLPDNPNNPITHLLKQYRQHEQQLPQPWTAAGMLDFEPGYNYPLNIRGEYDQLADPVPRGYLQVLTENTGSKNPSQFQSNYSGRHELAERIASPQNPLTARVYVNRVWQWLFGIGLVATPNDFGHLGELPSHPELLDFLTLQFIEQGWSTKQLIRNILLSQTWQQSGQISPAAHEQDPDNRLLHHFPLRRLEAESLRDAMLVVSNRFDRRLYGKPLNPPRVNEDPQKRLFSGPLDGNGRRSLYTKITIMEPPRFLSTFNLPEPKIPTGKRDVTSTPAQSLTLLNDPFVKGQADYWGTRITRNSNLPTQTRLTNMFQSALGRPPTTDELKRWEQLISQLQNILPPNQPDQIWKEVAHALFNTKEFLYFR